MLKQRSSKGLREEETIAQRSSSFGVVADRSSFGFTARFRLGSTGTKLLYASWRRRRSGFLRAYGLTRRSSGPAAPAAQRPDH